MKVKGLKKIESKKIPASIYIFTVKDEEGDIDLVVLDDIRKLVEGLLEEIDKIEDELKQELKEVEGWLTLENRYIEEIELIKRVKRKIKKWFAVVHYEAGNS